MSNSYKALYEFGYGFLGPILNHYLRKVAEYSQTHTPVCLAREGWILFEALKALREEELLEFKFEPIYLKVSRTVLFRSQAGNPKIMKLAFESKFEGTVLELLLKRFGFQLHEAFALLPHQLLDFNVKLPEDAALIEEWLNPHNDRLFSHVSPTREALASYFETSGLTLSETKSLMLDLGYAGTIQKILTYMFTQDTHGLYFIATKSGTHIINNHTATMAGVFKEDVKWSEGYLLLERSLLLESIMTAPVGQLVDVRLDSNNDLIFFHGRLATPQRQFQDLKAVMDGAIAGVVDGFRLNIEYNTREIEDIFTGYAKSPSAIPREAFHLFNIDDDFSGNGIISPMQLFGFH